MIYSKRTLTMTASIEYLLKNFCKLTFITPQQIENQKLHLFFSKKPYYLQCYKFDNTSSVSDISVFRIINSVLNMLHFSLLFASEKKLHRAFGFAPYS